MAATNLGDPSGVVPQTKGCRPGTNGPIVPRPTALVDETLSGESP